MGAYSDNAAARLLASLVDPAVLAAVNADLGLPDAGPSGGGRHISPREYGAVFRVLYNGSYVGRSLSRLALESFAESTFELGLVAGVPPGTLVAHKFGVWEGDDPPGPLQLHDCGIVYHPQRPYLLCVSGVSGLVGLALADGLRGPIVLVAALPFFLSYGLGQAITDTFQTDTDALSSPYRPLVRGEITRAQVLAISLGTLALIALLLALLNPWALLPAALAVAGVSRFVWGEVERNLERPGTGAGVSRP